MKTFAMRFTFGLTVATLAAGGLLLTANSANADDVETCWEVNHHAGNGVIEVIVIPEKTFYKAHAKHGDSVNATGVECTIEEELPI